MLDFARLPVEATVGVVSRYMAARVNPYTVIVGQALAHPFQLPLSGQENVTNAIGSLKVVGTLGKTLEIGFGIDDVVRSRAKSSDGTTCLALCAALQEVYAYEVAIDVLLKLARESQVDGQWMPSYSEWGNRLEACSGALSTSEFTLLVEHFIFLCDPAKRVGGFTEDTHVKYGSARGCSSPKSIAKALSALSKNFSKTAACQSGE